MRTKKKREVFTVGPLEETKEEIKDSPFRDDLQSTSPARERFQLSFDLNEDGTPDLTTMRGRTKEKVQAFFSDARMASAFGAKAPVQAEVQVFHPSMVAGMYAMLGAIEAMAVSRMAKVPESVAKQVFTYTPAEVEALTPPTVRVLNKYAAEWMIKYQDEIALATMLTAMTVTKVNMAIALSKVQNRNMSSNGSQEKSDESGKKEGVDTLGSVQ